MMLEEDDKNGLPPEKAVFFEICLGVVGFLIGTGKIFHDIASRDDPDKGFIVIKDRYKVLLHCLVQKILHL